MSKLLLCYYLTVGYAVGGPLFQYAGIQVPLFVIVILCTIILMLLTCLKNPTKDEQVLPTSSDALSLLRDTKILAGIG